MRAACGRADLVRALASGGPDMLEITAELLGYHPRSAGPAALLITPPAPMLGPVSEVGGEVVTTVTVAEQPELAFWRLERHELLPQREAPEQDQPPEPEPCDAAAVVPAHHEPLSTWRVLLPRLRQVLAEPIEGCAPDIDAIVARIAAGRQLDRVPRRRRSHWGSRAQIIVDRSDRLIPFWHDQDLIAPRLARLFPRHGVAYAAVWEGLTEPVLFTADGRREAYRLPPAGTRVVVLGDLGCLAVSSPALANTWGALGHRLAAAGSRPVALLPCPAERWANLAPAPWLRLAWEKPARPTREPVMPPAERADRLVTLLSPAIRIEPGLLRAVRRLLPPLEADAGTEADVWQHPAVTSPHSVAASLDPDEARRLRARFADDAITSPALRKAVLALLWRWRAELPAEIWFEEILSLDPAIRDACIDRGQIGRACRFFREVGQEITGDVRQRREGSAAVLTRAWFRRVERRLTETAWTDPHVGRALRRTSWLLHRDEPTRPPPPGLTPSDIPADLVGDPPPRRLRLRQHDGELLAAEIEGAAGGSLLGHIDSRNGLIEVAPADPFWASGAPPPWAHAWGTDRYGSWVAFAVTGADGQRVVQKLRWIKPGSFLMGSPDNEPERWDGEGPQHKATIARGFWLADTACTQGLWQAVMGDNPSQFKGPERPVETVSWQDARAFLGRLNARLPGLDLRLPSEAEWEYACRAGTATPFSFGAAITPEQVNYDGNVPYEGCRGGLFRQETVRVASLPANPWGLYEMHGNVLEWCEDHWHGGYQGAPADGSAWLDTGAEAGAHRVFRGGSWYVSARNVRSAFRFPGAPGDRDSHIGLRCARVQNGAEPRAAEQRGAVLRRLGDDGRASLPIPAAPAFVVATDCERLTFGQITRPPWARAIGRDRFGLWTEFSVSHLPAEAAGKKHSWRFWKSEEPASATTKTVTQHLRWIPPGRFLMGSPETEAGRDDREGPRHEVTISSGFWVFDTPCTQALWQAVTGDNPSRFQSPDRPVEQVSWGDVQGFLKRINEQVPGLDLVLPSEAQWEYACRAGTATAVYTGDIEILGERNAPALDPIAWYGGNSGEGFDLANGVDSSSWPERQFPHTRAGTRPVGLKEPNGWGLYDMLGNVWEWCADRRRDYTADAVSDPVGLTKAGAFRVLRGGSWRGVARSVRSAFRFAPVPGFRYGYFGFRCARVQEGCEPGRGPEALNRKECVAVKASRGRRLA